MAKFKFGCPLCGMELEAEEEWCGQSSECPGCHREFVIPPKPIRLKRPGGGAGNEVPVLRIVPPRSGHQTLMPEPPEPLRDAPSPKDESDGRKRVYDTSWILPLLKKAFHLALLLIVIGVPLWFLRSCLAKSDLEESAREAVHAMLMKNPNIPRDFLGERTVCASVKITGEITADEYDRNRDDDPFVGTGYYTGIARFKSPWKLKIKPELKVLIGKSDEKVEVCLAPEERVRFAITALLMQRSDGLFPQDLRALVCDSVKIVKEIDQKQYTGLPSPPTPIGDEKYYEAVAVMDNRRELKLKLKLRSGGSEVKILHHERELLIKLGE